MVLWTASLRTAVCPTVDAPATVCGPTQLCAPTKFLPPIGVQVAPSSALVKTPLPAIAA